LLASELAAAPYGLGPFTHRSLRRLLVEPASLHFAKHAFALHLLLEDAKSLLNVIVANQDLHASSSNAAHRA
jgi:hypothetical protein